MRTIRVTGKGPINLLNLVEEFSIWYNQTGTSPVNETESKNGILCH